MPITTIPGLSTLCNNFIQKRVVDLFQGWANFREITVPSVHSPFSVSSFKAADDYPALYCLRHFPVRDGHIDIAEEIGADYDKFGTLLLEDMKGNVVDSIRKSKHYSAVEITVEILKQWLQEKGIKPVTWQTFVECLRNADLNILAGNIEISLSSHNCSKNS